MTRRNRLAVAVVSLAKSTRAGSAVLAAIRSLIARAAARLRRRERVRRAWDRISTPVAFVTKEERFVVRADDSVIGRRIFLDGHFDLDKFVLATELLGRRSIRTLYDVGANLGSICIPAVRRGYADQAVAFEPDPVNFALLDMNCRWNGVENRISRHNCALGDVDSIVGLRHPETRNFGDVQVTPSAQGPITAWMRRLDDLGFDFDAHSDMLWMDVQGHELAVLAGASDAIRSGLPIVLELSPTRLSPSGSCERLQGLLSGYVSFVDLRAPERGWRSLTALPELWDTYAAAEGLETDVLVAAAD